MTVGKNQPFIIWTFPKGCLTSSRVKQKKSGKTAPNAGPCLYAPLMELSSQYFLIICLLETIQQHSSHPTGHGYRRIYTAEADGSCGPLKGYPLCTGRRRKGLSTWFSASLHIRNILQLFENEDKSKVRFISSICKFFLLEEGILQFIHVKISQFPLSIF